MLLGRRTRLQRESSALPAAARHTFLLTDTLGRGDLHVCVRVSRAVCISGSVVELELSGSVVELELSGSVVELELSGSHSGT